METAHAGQRLFIVQKLDWQYNDAWYSLMEDIPVKAFLDRDLAQKYCDELTAQEQERWATMRATYEEGGTDLTEVYGGLRRITTLSSNELAHRIKEGGLPSPPTRLFGIIPLAEPDFYNWKWWSKVWRTLPLERRAWFWSLFDLVQFYEVVEVELMP